MIYPSIDLMDGKAVQLVQGKRERKKIEVVDVMGLAERLSRLGEISVIDLDAAFATGNNQQIICEIAAKYAVRVGGGIRSIAQAQMYLSAGAKRVIIGSNAFADGVINEPFLADLCKAVGRESIIIALDSVGSSIVIKGWTESVHLDAKDVIRALEPFCVEFLYTQVDREGLMGGTDIERVMELKRLTKNAVSAAGGISSMAEINELASYGINSVLGMALYTGRIDF